MSVYVSMLDPSEHPLDEFVDVAYSILGGKVRLIVGEGEVEFSPDTARWVASALMSAAREAEARA